MPSAVGWDVRRGARRRRFLVEQLVRYLSRNICLPVCSGFLPGRKLSLQKVVSDSFERDIRLAACKYLVTLVLVSLVLTAWH